MSNFKLREFKAKDYGGFVALQNSLYSDHPTTVKIIQYHDKIHEEKIYIRLSKPQEESAAGSTPISLPMELKVNIPTILKPRNPDEELD